MRNSRTLQFFVSSVSLALILSLLLTITVVADDLPPSTEEPIRSEEETPPPTEAPQELPADIPVVVVADEGIEPLATQQALNAFVVGDPIWCPTGAPPIPSAGGCTASYANLSSLITAIENLDIPEPAANGVIWITAGADTSPSTVLFDGPTFSTWRNFELTLQGGWDGSPAGTITGATVFSVPLLIFEWGAPITINNLSVNSTASTGLYVESSDDVSLEEVSVSGNAGIGLYVEAGGNIDARNLNASNNNSGAFLNSAGDISLSGTNVFVNNTNTGLYAEAAGGISVENLSVEDNDTGALLLADGDIAMSGSNEFNNNTNIGLYADAAGDINAENLSAVGNSLAGAILAAGGNVTLTGANIFNSTSGGYGLYAEAGGSIEAENLDASDNNLAGASLIAAGDISLTGINVFNNNAGGYGLYADAGANLAAENLEAADNGASGALVFAVGDIILSGVNVFSDNGGSGLLADAGGNLVLENITASGNALAGAEAFGGGTLSLTGVNVFDDNGASGLYADMAGDIDAENLSAFFNGETGVTLVSGGNVNLTGVNVFNQNNYSGLSVEADGDITVENLTAEGNGLVGVELTGLNSDIFIFGTNIFGDNTLSGLYVEAGGGNVYAENLYAYNNGLIGGYGHGAEFYSLNQFVLSGSSEFIGNNDSGIFVDAGGDILAENILSEDNGGSGAEFYSLGGSFTLNGVNAFNSNFSDGLFVSVNGNIAIFFTDAMLNGGNGMFLETNGNADVTCGLVLNNGLFAINTSLPGLLRLYGVNFGGSPDANIGADPYQIRLISNSCFTYPSGPGSGGFFGGSEDPLRIRFVSNVDGLDIPLKCDYYDGTHLTLSNGDGAYIPCPIVDTVRLDRVLETDVAEPPPPGAYVSGMDVLVTKEGEKFFQPITSPDVVWFVNPQSFAGFEAARWDGKQWLDITYDIPPFITVFFRIPPELREADLAIAYWNDSEWIELTANTHLGQGQIVRQTGRSSFSPDFSQTNPNGIYFIAEVNFIGRFVLMQK